MVSEGHSLHDLLDYEEGISVDEFFSLYRFTVKLCAERERKAVGSMVLAIGSIFDKKVLQEFNRSMDKLLRSLDSVAPRGDPKEKKKAVAHSMRELSKLNALFKQG